MDDEYNKGLINLPRSCRKIDEHRNHRGVSIAIDNKAQLMEASSEIADIGL